MHRQSCSTSDTVPTQHDYRIFVGAFPVGDLADRIQSVRERHDPKTARITAPHITLAGTYWRCGSPTPDNEAAMIARLLAIQDRLPPVELTLGGIETFLPEVPVIYLHIEATPALLALREALMSALGRDKHQHFVPHLTLAMRLNEVDTRALFDDLRQTDWHTQRFTQRLDHLWLMQRGKHDPAWRYIHRIELKRS
jgi:2'-5' RNA ligase